MARDFHHLWKSGKSLQWRHNERDGVSNHQPRHCLLNRLFRHRSKKTSKVRVTGLYVGNSPVTSEFPAQRATSAENVSIWWRLHGDAKLPVVVLTCLFGSNQLSNYLDRPMIGPQNEVVSKFQSKGKLVRKHVYINIASLSLYCGFDEVMTFHYVRK